MHDWLLSVFIIVALFINLPIKEIKLGRIPKSSQDLFLSETEHGATGLVYWHWRDFAKLANLLHFVIGHQFLAQLITCNYSLE